MTDESDATLTGAAYELANAGYRSMPDGKPRQEEELGSDGASLREAAERISVPRDELIVRKYVGHDGESAAENETVTLERAGRDYADARAGEDVASDHERSKELAGRIDALRAEALAQDPEAADFYGFEIPESRTPGDEPGARADVRGEGDDPQISRLDPVLEEALRHPQVRQAIDEEITEVHKARQTYLDGLAAATQIAQASFVSQFPELVGIAPENLPGALEHMSRQDPAKFARVQAIVASTEDLFARQQQEGIRQAEQARHNFHAFARSEDARLESMLKDEPTETQRAVTEEILASARASGIEPAEFFRLFNSEPLMRNATFQRMMYDAGKYRLMMKAKDAALARSLPPVQRPGASGTRAEREQADLRTLSARLSSSGDIKDAVALYSARKLGKR